jgi:Helix-turn-helix domain
MDLEQNQTGDAVPWKQSSVMDERLRFVARHLDEPMTEVCRDFGISRKTGYKIFDRYKEHGLEARADRSRRPVRLANQLPAQLEARIVARSAGHFIPRRRHLDRQLYAPRTLIDRSI